MKNADIAHRIRLTKKKLGVTQEEFAHLLGITQPAVSNYLNGRIPPGPVLLKIAQIGSVSLEWLLTGEGDTKQRVSENKMFYQAGEQLAKKINQLPPELQKTLEILIDHLVRLYSKDHR